MKVKAILETCLYATDLVATEAFYKEVLGLEPFSKAPGRYLFYYCGAGVLLIFNPAKSAVQNIKISGSKIPQHGAAGEGHICFKIKKPEISDWRNWLIEKGVEIESEVTWDSGDKSIYFRDPAGNCLEVASAGLWVLPEE
ncbi:MAG TPA: glyoxalase/bleomycin resistance/extradiol dioxygenase family protein [Bacteroidetes bacterium]|nr:glyoxalase/bleomycin resistance/extradiol dioxygenase family protein [Bacteroidota bacterium]